MADDKNMQNTVQIIPDPKLGGNDSIESNSLILQFAQNNSTFIPFGHAIRARDEQLAAFWKTEPFLSSAINSIVMTRASLSWELTGPPQSVSMVQQILKKSDFGRGWQSLMAKIALDLLQADNGAFIEIVRGKPRKGRKPESAPIIALNHLPSSNCIQTGNPTTPVIYIDENGVYHELKWYEVIPVVEIPVPNRSNKNIQFSFVSRVLDMAETIKAIATYQKEKVTGRFGSAIHIVSGVKQHDIDIIERQAQQKATNRGLLNYMPPIILSTIDPTSKVAKETIELASYPDNFNYNELLVWYITLLALASGSDYMDFGPLPGKGLGTAAQSDSLAQKSRVKGILLFMKIIENALEQSRVLPPNVSFRYTNADATAEREDADIKKIRAETRKIQIEDLEITPEVARQMAVDSGDLAQEYLVMMGETQNNTISIRDDERVSELILNPEQSNVPVVKPTIKPENNVKPMVANKAASWIRRKLDESSVQAAAPIPATQLQTFEEHLRNWLTNETVLGTDDVWLNYTLVKAAKHSGINPLLLRQRLPDNYEVYVKSNSVSDSNGLLIYAEPEKKEIKRATIKEIVDRMEFDKYGETIKEIYQLANKPLNAEQIKKHYEEVSTLRGNEKAIKLKLLLFYSSLI